GAPSIRGTSPSSLAKPTFIRKTRNSQDAARSSVEPLTSSSSRQTLSRTVSVNTVTKIPLTVQEGTEEEEDELIDRPIRKTVTMTKMPDPYARDAPKFHYDRPEELNRFIK